MSKFESKFFKLLEQEISDIDSPDSITPEGDREAFEGSFENPEDAEQFSPDPQMAGFQQKYVEKAKGWIEKINGFVTWLNSPEGDSLNRQLIAMDKPNSPFEGISSEAKKITGISKDLAGLSESIKGVVLTADKKQRDVASQQAQLSI